MEGLERIKASNRPIGIISGGSYGWAACLVRLLPVDVFVFENGAGYFSKEAGRIHLSDVGQRDDRKELTFIFSELKKEFPELKLAADDDLRRFDCAIDIGQEQHVTPEIVQAVLDLLAEKPGIQARPSSIHINFWKGNYSKASTLDVWRTTKGIPKENSLYVGDSLNDEPLFAEYKMSVGVANVARHLARMKNRPVWILQGEGGNGFAELADLICRR